MNLSPLSRREFIGQSSLAAAVGVAGVAHGTQGEDAKSHQATSVRVGEVTQTSAVIWVRLTAHAERNNTGLLIPGRAAGKKPEQLAKVTVPVEDLEGACPSANGRVRVRYGSQADLSEATTTAWVDVSIKDDGIHQFVLRDLLPGRQYYYATETAGPGGQPVHGSLRGQFHTAFPEMSEESVRFCVMTCQGYPDRGHPDGHGIYPSMQAFHPHFACLTGDLVYYDNDEPRANTPRLARYHWERMFSLPRLHTFTRTVGTYWLKDDHDTLKDDTWPGGKMGELTFAEGQTIFRQQAPLADGPAYRTIRWGRHLQVWFVEGRDYRSPNRMPDGPDKTIWGNEQKRWFKETVQASTASWKVLVSPTPLVGPDRKNKNDNHANGGFQHEGDELRKWIRDHVADHFFVICGDRHWQYHSVHPQTGLNEFSVGAASDEHAGGTPGENTEYHRFHRVKGGFLAVTVDTEGNKPRIRFELRDVPGKIVYTHTATRAG